MKKYVKHLVFCAFLVACATQVTKTPDQTLPSEDTTTSGNTPAQPDSTPPVIVVPTPKQYKTPTLVIPATSSSAMKKASEYFAQFGNSQEFFDFFTAKSGPLAGGNVLDKSVAVEEFRKCMDGLGRVEVYFKSYSVFYRRSVIGGWDGTAIRQNPAYSLTAEERAGHWLHELSHGCGFTHEVNGRLENDPIAYPILNKSFPYQVGDQFIEFLKVKTAPALAGE